MSHFNTYGITVKNMECLIKAAESMGLAVTKNCECRAYNQTKKFPFGIKLSAALYDVGLTEVSTGEYRLMYDSFFKGGVEEIIGRKGDILLSKYAELLLKQESAKKGFKVYGKSGDTRFTVVPSNEPNKQLHCKIENGKAHFNVTGCKGNSCNIFRSLEEKFGDYIDGGPNAEAYECEDDMYTSNYNT